MSLVHSELSQSGKMANFKSYFAQLTSVSLKLTDCYASCVPLNNLLGYYSHKFSTLINSVFSIVVTVSGDG